MKLSAISIAIVLAGIAGAAVAGNANTMQTVHVSGLAIAQCMPPDDSAGRACDRFDQLVRATFTEREIGMLFGDRTSYPEYLTGGIDRLQHRYQVVVQQYLAEQSQAAKSASLAAK